MKSILALHAKSLRWVPVGPRYELYAGDELVASIERDPTDPTMAAAVTADGAWNFQRSGNARAQIAIFHRGDPTRFALFLPRSGLPRRLLLLDGATFTWKPDCERGARAWKFVDGQDVWLFTLTLEGVGGTLEGEIEPAPWARHEPLLPLLIVLAWFEVWMEHEPGPTEPAFAPTC